MYRPSLEAWCAVMDETVHIDALLLARVAQRDAEALAALYDRHAKHVFSLAQAILKDRDGAADLTQEVFLLTWRHAATYRPTGTARSWLLRLTRNRAIDELRRQKRRPEAQSANPTEFPWTITVSSSRTDTVEGLEVREAVDALPQPQREALCLSFFQGMSHQEIANRLHLPLGTIKARIRRAILSLRQQLKGKGNLS